MSDVRALWRLSWPLVVSLQLVAYSDAIVVFWLGRLIGPAALATEATMRYVFLCAVAMMLGVATGVSVLVSRSVGARDGRGLAIIANGLALCGVLWIAAIAIALPLGGPIGDALASHEVGAAALRAYYLPWLALALPGIGVVQVLLQAASGAGWTRLSLTRAVIDLVLTALAVPALIELGLGIAGAPIALGVVQLAVAVLVARLLWRARERWSLGDAARLRVDRALWWQLLDIGMPPQLARVAMLGAYAYLAQQVALDGRSAVAAYGIALALIFMAFNLTSALGRGAGILVGQSAGAQAWDRARRAIRTALALGIGSGAAFAIVFVAAGRPLASLFTSDADVIDRVARALQILAWAAPLTSIAQVLLFVFAAMKTSKRAGVLGIAADAIGIAFALAWHGESRLEVVAWSIVLSNAVRAALFVTLWRWSLAPRLAQAVTSTNSV